jgi:hypothetical protein
MNNLKYRLRSERDSKDEPFGNTDVVLERPDPNMPLIEMAKRDRGVWHWRDDDGPVHLVIGPLATSRDLQHAASMLGVQVEALEAFLDMRLH